MYMKDEDIISQYAGGFSKPHKSFFIGKPVGR